jgi:hypothetical protein
MYRKRTSSPKFLNKNSSAARLKQGSFDGETIQSIKQIPNDKFQNSKNRYSILDIGYSITK